MNTAATQPEMSSVQQCSAPGAGSAARPSDLPRAPDLSRILGLYVPVSVMLADRLMSIESILKMNVGTIIEFDVAFDSELVLEVADHPIGHGMAIKVGENFGLRITRVGSVEDRIHAMGGL
jgi:flagellar motor switch protein FliN/FliY